MLKRSSAIAPGSFDRNSFFGDKNKCAHNGHRSSHTPYQLPPACSLLTMAFRFREDSKEEFELLGYSDLRWDEEYLQPEEGFPPIKTKEYPESVWDEALWPLSPSKNRPRVRFLVF